MTDIFYPVAHRSDEEIAALKDRYQRFDATRIPEIFANAGFTALSWNKPESWSTSHVIYIVTVKEQIEPLVLRANIGWGEPEAYMQVEKLITDKVATLGIPTNKIISVDISRKQFAFDYQIQELLEGHDIEDHFDGSNEAYDTLSFQIGTYIAMWGEVQCSGFGRFDTQLRGTKNSMYEYMIVQLDNDIRFLVDSSVVSMTRADAIRTLFETYKDVMVVKYPTLVHYDLADHNIMFDGKQTITGIFDWEAAVAGDPVLDLASAPTWKTHFAREEKMLEGYQSIRQLPDFFEEKKHIYRLRTMIWKMVYAIRAGILTEDRKKKFDTSLAPFKI